jgi:hypothetical protein
MNTKLAMNRRHYRPTDSKNAKIKISAPKLSNAGAAKCKKTPLKSCGIAANHTARSASPLYQCGPVHHTIHTGERPQPANTLVLWDRRMVQ